MKTLIILLQYGIAVTTQVSAPPSTHPHGKFCSNDIQMLWSVKENLLTISIKSAPNICIYFNSGQSAKETLLVYHSNALLSTKCSSLNYGSMHPNSLELKSAIHFVHFQKNQVILQFDLSCSQRISSWVDQRSISEILIGPK